MTLIDNWQRAWRLSSVRAAMLLLVLSVLQGMQSDVLPLVQGLIRPDVWPWVSAAFATAILVLRVIKQVGALDETPAESERGRQDG